VVSNPSLSYAHPYETGERIFGAPVPADALLARVRMYSWRKSLAQLAELAAIVANTPDHAKSELVRRLTVDPLRDVSCANEAIRRNAVAALANRRNEMVLAHEEALLFLQHLVILEGLEDGPAPSRSEIAFWLAGANDHIEEAWAEDSSSLSAGERLAAEMIRASRYNNNPDMLRTFVRTAAIFGTPSPMAPLNDVDLWRELQHEAFGMSFTDFFETGPSLISILAQGWGLDGRLPVVDSAELGSALASSDPLASLRWMIGDRQSIVAETRKRMRSNGLPRTPTALLHTPIVEVMPGKHIAVSPWAMLNQLRTGIWARYLAAAKSSKTKIGVDEWNASFGYMVEGWCGRVARAAKASPACSATILIPSHPGARDEIEDVVVIEGRNAILFSVKSRLVEAKVSREALSPAVTLAWFDEFFFAPKKGKFRPGAAALLSARIDKLRAGEFERFGAQRDLRVYPVIVTYDSLGENDLWYRQFEKECGRRSILQQTDVGPLTLARVNDFEQLMIRAAKGKSISGLLTNRERGDQHRRLDQIIYEVNGPGFADRLPLFDADFENLTRAIKSRLRGAAGDVPTSDLSVF
jgi:hypothetical protein